MKLESFTVRAPDGFVLDMPALELEDGRIYAVAGANGSGKSTFAKAAAGILPAESGGKICPCAVGYMPQHSRAFRMTVRSNLLLTGGSEERADLLLDSLGISRLAERKAHRLSGGETARMALARVLMCPKPLLILDEPCASMDMESTFLAEKCIKDCVREFGSTVLLPTHSLQQARRIADGILFLHNGRLIEYADTESLLTAPREPETKQFLEFYGII